MFQMLEKSSFMNFYTNGNMEHPSLLEERKIILWKKNSEYCDEHCSFDHFVMELHATLQLHEKILGKKIGAYDNTKSMQKADVRDWCVRILK